MPRPVLSLAGLGWLLPGCSGGGEPGAWSALGSLRDLPVQEPSGLADPAVAPDLDPTDGVVSVELVADEATFEVAGLLIEGFAFNGQVPGPTIRAQKGDELLVTVRNDLDAPTTVHWHGLEVPWAEDGITWLTDPIAPGDTRSYRFPLGQAGTFWYHPHMDVDHQVDWGLYGALVVSDPSDPPTDVERVLVFDDWSDESESEDGHGGDDTGADAHAGEPEEGTWTVNGTVQGTVSLVAGTTARVRMLNVSNNGYLSLDPGGRVIARDQGIGSAPESELLLGPGDRAEVEWLVGSTGWDVTDAAYTLFGSESWGGEETRLTVEVEGTTGSVPSLDWAFGKEPPSEDGSPDVIYVLQGEGESMSINGEVYPEVTVEEIPVGLPSILEVRNLSSTEHTFHLHGMRFEVLSIRDVAPAHRTYEDTINVPIHDWVRLRVVPPEPGDWMAHCHILDHEERGMMTVLRVTPF